MCDWLFSSINPCPVYIQSNKGVKMLQNHEQSSKAQTWLLCLCWRFLSIRSARVGHLTFVLQKYQQYLSVEWRWNARKLGSTGQQISARPGQFTILGWIILISEHDVAACDPTYQSRRNSLLYLQPNSTWMTLNLSTDSGNKTKSEHTSSNEKKDSSQAKTQSSDKSDFWE